MKTSVESHKCDPRRALKFSDVHHERSCFLVCCGHKIRLVPFLRKQVPLNPVQSQSWGVVDGVSFSPNVYANGSMGSNIQSYGNSNNNEVSPCPGRPQQEQQAMKAQFQQPRQQPPHRRRASHKHNNSRTAKFGISYSSARYRRPHRSKNNKSVYSHRQSAKYAVSRPAVVFSYEPAWSPPLTTDCVRRLPPQRQSRQHSDPASKAAISYRRVQYPAAALYRLRRELKITLLRVELEQTLALHQDAFMVDGTSHMEYDPEQPWYGLSDLAYHERHCKQRQHEYHYQPEYFPRNH